MIRDITIGQYFPGKSLIHRLDPRSKIIGTLVMIASLFVCKNFVSLLTLFALSVVFVLISRISFRIVLKGLKMIFILIIFTGILQITYNTDGEVLWKPFEQYDFAVTTGGIYSAVFITLRIIALILFGSLLTYTTSPTMLTSAIEKLLLPLKVFRVNVHALAMMMTIAIRFIPTLIEEINIIMNAQKARGADFETGSVAKRAKALVPLFVPLFVSAFRRAYELAFAMECRCYNGDKGRTKLKVMKFAARDCLSLVFYAVLLSGVIFTAVFPLGNYLPADLSFLFERVI